MLRIAMPVFHDRVSPVFDAAKQLLLLDTDGTAELSRMTVPVPEEQAVRRVARLSELGVAVLICGGISRPLASLIEASGIQLVPWMVGQVDQVFRAYLTGEVPNAAMFAPGCRGRRQRFRGGWGIRARRGRMWP